MASSQNSLRRKWLTAYAPLAVWMFVILGLGGGIGSATETSLFVRPLLHFLFPSASEETYQFYHAIIRKSAHVFEYAMLAVLAYRVSAGERKPHSKVFLFPAILLISVASIDELHQSFLESRTSSPYDVLLDVFSGTAALAGIWLFARKQTGS